MLLPQSRSSERLTLVHTMSKSHVVQADIVFHSARDLAHPAAAPEAPADKDAADLIHPEADPTAETTIAEIGRAHV